MNARDVLDTGIKNILIATGSHYRRDGVGRTIHAPIPGHNLPGIFTPDDVMDGASISGRVVIYDDDHFYMAGVLAEKFAKDGCAVTLVTPAPMISYWTQFTLEQEKIEKRLLELGVTFLPRHLLTEIQSHSLNVTCSITGAQRIIDRDHVILVTDRKPNDQLYHDLLPHLESGALETLRVIGDAEAPSTIAQAVYAGHLAAREFDEDIDPDVTPFKVERVTDFSISLPSF